MATNQLLPFATGPGALVLGYSAYLILPARASGFQTGISDPYQLNTAWRQGSFAAAMIGQFTADYSGANVNDDGNVAVFETNFVNALRVVSQRAISAFSYYMGQI